MTFGDWGIGQNNFPLTAMTSEKLWFLRVTTIEEEQSMLSEKSWCLENEEQKITGNKEECVKIRWKENTSGREIQVKVEERQNKCKNVTNTNNSNNLENKKDKKAKHTMKEGTDVLRKKKKILQRRIYFFL